MKIKLIGQISIFYDILFLLFEYKYSNLKRKSLLNIQNLIIKKI